MDLQSIIRSILSEARQVATPVQKAWDQVNKEMGDKEEIRAYGQDFAPYAMGMTGPVNELGLTHSMPMNLLVSHEGAPDEARVLEYMRRIMGGEKIDPLKVINEGLKYGIEDGKHRFEAFRRLGYKEVPIQFIKR